MQSFLNSNIEVSTATLQSILSIIAYVGSAMGVAFATRRATRKMGEIRQNRQSKSLTDWCSTNACKLPPTWQIATIELVKVSRDHKLTAKHLFDALANFVFSGMPKEQINQEQSDLIVSMFPAKFANRVRTILFPYLFVGDSLTSTGMPTGISVSQIVASLRDVAKNDSNCNVRENAVKSLALIALEQQGGVNLDGDDADSKTDVGSFFSREALRRFKSFQDSNKKG